MKKQKIFFLLMAALVIQLSCRKDNRNFGTPTAFTIVHAWVGGNKLVADFFGVPMNYYSTAPQISYGGSMEYSPAAGTGPLAISQITDTSHAVYNNTLSLAPGAAYTLFLTGKSATPDTLLTRDTIPYHPATDSVVGIRFVNLSPGSSPVSINIQNGAHGSEVPALAYKAITSFKPYPATSTVTKYVFEIRDAASGNLLYTYTYSGLARFRNVTVAVKGLAGGTGTSALGTILVNDF
ncbi:MAG TPA: DUF4397 domain-containing protein [Puia sp.]|jgi:hypothetical protein